MQTTYFICLGLATLFAFAYAFYQDTRPIVYADRDIDVSKLPEADWGPEDHTFKCREWGHAQYSHDDPSIWCANPVCPNIATERIKTFTDNVMEGLGKSLMPTDYGDGGPPQPLL